MGERGREVGEKGEGSGGKGEGSGECLPPVHPLNKMSTTSKALMAEFHLPSVLGQTLWKSL